MNVKKQLYIMLIVSGLIILPLSSQAGLLSVSKTGKTFQLQNTQQAVAQQTVPRFSDLPRIGSLWLVDADDSTQIAEITNGATFDVEQLPENISIIALANQHTESVRFSLDTTSSYRTENIEPYAIEGDNNGDYNAIDLSRGWHTIRAKPFASDGATGVAGPQISVRFALITNRIIVDTLVDAHDSVFDGQCASAPVLTYSKLVAKQTRPSLVLTKDRNETAFGAYSVQGSCSLRAAIEEANQMPGIQFIEVPDLHLPYLLDLGEIQITDSVVITGMGNPYVDAQGRSRILNVNNVPLVHLTNMRLKNGRTDFNDFGGAIKITSSGVQLVNMQILDSHANLGGGVFASEESVLTIVKTVFQGNIGGNPDGFSGGGVTQRGGGLAVEGGHVHISNSSFYENRAVRGGGMFISGADVNFSNSFLIFNEAADFGGAINIQEDTKLRISYSTIAYNKAGLSQEANRPWGGGIVVYDSKVDVGNSILAENVVEYPDNTVVAPDCWTNQNSEITSHRGNVIGVLNGNCSIEDVDPNENLSDLYGSEDAPLDSGMNNSVATYPLPHVGLTPDSPAIDNANGTSSILFFANCPSVDASGDPRPSGDTCDSGASEFQF